MLVTIYIFRDSKLVAMVYVIRVSRRVVTFSIPLYRRRHSVNWQLTIITSDRSRYTELLMDNSSSGYGGEVQTPRVSV